MQVQELSDERRAMYAAAVSVTSAPTKPLSYEPALPGFDQGAVAAVLCDDAGQKVQHLVHQPPGGSPTVATLSCKIMMEDLSPTQMVEYRFPEGGWMLSGMGVDACEMYRGQKWEIWLKQWKQPDCKAAVVRTIQTGLANRLFDTSLLPTPEADMPQWTVTDEKTGKLSYIVRPVAEMRIWNAATGEYDEMSSLLEGAPEDSQVASVWKEMLDTLRAGFIEIDGQVLSGADLLQQALG